MRQKSNGTHLILMELMMVLLRFFVNTVDQYLLHGICKKLHNIKCKSKEKMTETKKLCNTSCRTDRSGRV